MKGKKLELSNYGMSESQYREIRDRVFAKLGKNFECGMNGQMSNAFRFIFMMVTPEYSYCNCDNLEIQNVEYLVNKDNNSRWEWRCISCATKELTIKLGDDVSISDIELKAFINLLLDQWQFTCGIYPNMCDSKPPNTKCDPCFINYMATEKLPKSITIEKLLEKT